MNSELKLELAASPFPKAHSLPAPPMLSDVLGVAAEGAAEPAAD